MNRFALLALCLALFAGCTRQAEKDFTPEVMNSYTPVKDQGETSSCWIYAMLAAIETEHIMRGDSVNLSPAWVEKRLADEPSAPRSGRGMGLTLLTMISRHGIVAYDAMRTVDTPEPRWVFMHGAQYTKLEFAHSVCAPNEYVGLTSRGQWPMGRVGRLDVDDNWTGETFLNIPMDSLLSLTERAVRTHHGVCWESASHAMSVIGLAHDQSGKRYFVMKNSWGKEHGNHNGLDYLSFEDFRRQTLAVTMPRVVLEERLIPNQLPVIAQ